MDKLPDLISKKIWQHKLKYVFNDIKNQNHKLIRKYTNNKENIPHNLMMFAINFNYLCIGSNINIHYQN